MRIRRGYSALLPILAAAGIAASCYEFHLVGPEEPDPESPPEVVSVTIEYTQLRACTEGSPECDQPVIFQGSWMQRGAEFSLTRDEVNRVWRGRAYSVPVNFPPRSDPYRVRVHDPLLQDGPTQGWTGQRLVVGGEAVWRLVYPDTPTEHSVVYIDSNGRGRNVY